MKRNPLLDAALDECRKAGVPYWHEATAKGHWAERIMLGEHLEEEMQNAGVLPHANTPLPLTNATIHIFAREDGYGTSERRFIALCGVSWLAHEGTGQHKYFFAGETHWHKHVNCPECQKLIGQGSHDSDHKM